MRNTITGIFLLLLFSGNVLAHKVSIFAYAENGKIFTESYFSDGKGSMNSVVEVFDGKNKKLLLTGKTNKTGEFSFRIPQVTALRIVVTASMGHKNEYVLSEDEVRAALGSIKTANNFPSKVSSKISSKNTKREEGPPSLKETTPIESHELELIVERGIQKKIAPVMKKLMKMEEEMNKPNISEILGGIGYIFGLMGILTYLKYKLKKPNE
jgi:nickel transport protein